MSFNVINDGKSLIKHWTDGVLFEEEAKRQLLGLASMPFVFKHVAVMPDVHAGKGSTVGSVVATDGAVIPAAVGVDIGCGMIACRTGLSAGDLPDSLRELRLSIEEAIPHGGPGAVGAFKDSAPVEDLAPGYKEISSKHPVSSRFVWDHFGTLGTGNHFVEVCLDESSAVWVVLHSGSRGVGNRIGTYFIDKAREEMRRWFVNLPDKDLAYLPDGSDLFYDYVSAVSWAQKYAFMSREKMMDAALGCLAGHTKKFEVQEKINCHHNYLAHEHHFGRNVWVTRKGAVRARNGDFGIIPGSMGARSYIVRGKGNADSFTSCSHGAGRCMSRNDARKKISLEQFSAAMDGVEARRDEGVIDEAPQAYKDIDLVMKAQEDLVEIVHTLKQVLCVKG